MYTNRKNVTTVFAGICLVTLQSYSVTAFVPSSYSVRNTFNLHTKVEDVAESLHFATVAKKDHLGPDFPRRDSKDTSADPALKKKNKSSNRKKNDPKAYRKKNEKSSDRNSNKRSEKNPVKKIEKEAVARTAQSKLTNKKNEKESVTPTAALKLADKKKGKKPVEKKEKEAVAPTAESKLTDKKKKEKEAVAPTAESKLTDKKKGKKPVKKKEKDAVAPTAELKLANKKKGKKLVKKKEKEAVAPTVESKLANKKGKKPFKKLKKSAKKNESEPTPLPLTELKLGSKVEGRVAAFTDFGVFVKINYNLKNKGGAGYALLHKSQIRDETVEDPKKLFRIGNVVKDLRVITINYEKGEVGVSLRKQRDSRKSVSEFQIGKEYKGKVARVVTYGAFIDVGAKANALLHISRISQKKIENIRNWVNEGDTVNIRIVSKDDKKNTLAASMLDMEADEYLNKRSKQLKKMRQRSDEKNARLMKGGQLKSELEYFEDAVKDLESALK